MWMGLITAMFVNLRESISCGVGVFEYSIEESRESSEGGGLSTHSSV